MGGDEGRGGKGTQVAVASVGSLSGVLGTITQPMLQGMQTWVKYINAKGGANGHEVRLIPYDDGADPARHRAQIQQAVERDGAVAFLMNTDAVTGAGDVKYLEAKRVAHIGSTGGLSWGYSSPMYFPQQSDADAASYSWMAAVAGRAVPEGKTKLGTLVCSESPQCAHIEGVWTRAVKGLGLAEVYRAKGSITQPDYTAECLAARNAGVEVFMLLLDPNSTGRVASSCVRQGFRPTFASTAALVLDRFKSDPNLNGFITSSNIFPWFQRGTPATNEFHDSLRALAPKVSAEMGVAIGWTAGKLFERATANLPEPPTSAAVLEGLWKIKNDTLGGLTQPLTFTQDKPATPLACWWTIVQANASWVSPGGFKQTCKEASSY